MKTAVHKKWSDLVSGNKFITGVAVLLLFTLILQCVRDPLASATQKKLTDVSPEGIIHAYHKLYTDIETRDIYIAPVISARFLMSLNMTIREIILKYDAAKINQKTWETRTTKNSDSLTLSAMLNTALSDHLQTIFSNRVKSSSQLISNQFSSIDKHLLSLSTDKNPDIHKYQQLASAISDSMAARYLPGDYIEFPDFTVRDSLNTLTLNEAGHQSKEWIHSLLRYSSILPDLSLNAVVLPEINRFKPLSSKELHKEALEVYALSKPLQYEYKWIAEFWSDDLPGVTFSPATRWISILNQLVEKEKPTFEVVRDVYFFTALVMHETAVICWDMKYSTLQSRPSHYIRENIDPTWIPFHHNPSFPGYPSGHSAFGASSSIVLEHFFGKKYSFTDNTHKGNRAFLSEPRSYGSFREMANENALSRLYIGVHFRKDCEDGIVLGEYVAKSIIDRLLPSSSFNNRSGTETGQRDYQ